MIRYIFLALVIFPACCPKPKHCYEQQSRYSHQELLNEAAAELAHGQDVVILLAEIKRLKASLEESLSRPLKEK